MQLNWQVCGMTPADLIERREIAWTPLEDRFSQSSREVPVSGKPAAPPADHEPVKRRINDGLDAKAVKPRSIAAPTQRAPRADKGIRGVRSYHRSADRAYSNWANEPCTKTKQPHQWHPRTSNQVQCRDCKRRSRPGMVVGLALGVAA